MYRKRGSEVRVLARVSVRSVEASSETTTSKEGKSVQGEVILSGIAASPGIVSGKIKIVNFVV